MNSHQRILKEQLQRVIDLVPGGCPGYAYSCVEDFVLRHGVLHEVGKFPRGVKPGVPKLCFGNALAMAALKDWWYIEGFALTKFGFYTAHGWNVDGDGRLIDVTWRNGGLAYLGVEFALGRAFDAQWEGDACVIDDWKRGWPLFRQEWQGEDFDRWPVEEAKKRIMETWIREAATSDLRC